MSRRISVPHAGHVQFIIRPTDDGTRIAFRAGGFQIFLHPYQARAIADLLHDAADDVDAQEATG